MKALDAFPRALPISALALSAALTIFEPIVLSDMAAVMAGRAIGFMLVAAGAGWLAWIGRPSADPAARSQFSHRVCWTVLACLVVVQAIKLVGLNS